MGLGQHPSLRSQDTNQFGEHAKARSCDPELGYLIWLCRHDTDGMMTKAHPLQWPPPWIEREDGFAPSGLGAGRSTASMGSLHASSVRVNMRPLNQPSPIL